MDGSVVGAGRGPKSLMELGLDRSTRWHTSRNGTSDVTASASPASAAEQETVMKKNVGGIDRAFRALFGLGVIAVGVYFKSWWGALGAIPLLTAVFQWCPIYVPFGASTCTQKPTGGAARPSGAS